MANPIATTEEARAPISRRARRVAVFIASGLTQAILATSALALIRAYHGTAPITLFTTPELELLFRDCIHIDDVETEWQPRGVFGLPALWWRLSQSDIDVAYDLTHDAATALALRLFWPRVVDTCGPDIKCTHRVVLDAPQATHFLDQYRQQMDAAGIKVPEGSLPMPNLDYMAPPPAPLGAPANPQPFALLLPEAPAHAPALAWPARRFGELAASLHRRNIVPIIAGGPLGVNAAAEILQICPDARNMVAKLPLATFVQLAMAADLVVGGESDVMTLAAAAGAPCVALINAEKRLVLAVSPRGRATVTLVSKDFARIAVSEILAAAAAVVAD